MTKNKKGIRPIRLEAENFHRLRFADVKLDGTPGLKRITSGGENAQGKTSTLLILAELLGGDGAVRPDAIHEAADGGWARATFDNGLVVEKRFTPSAPNGYLSVTVPSGPDPDSPRLSPAKPQTFLNSLGIGPRAFDPLALFQLKAKALREAILSTASDKALSEKLDALAVRKEALEEERTPWGSKKQRAERMTEPEGERPEPVDVSGTLARIAEARKVKERRAEVASRNVELDAKASAAERAIEDTTDRIRGLEDELERLNQHREGLRKNWRGLQEAMKENEKALDAIPDTTAEVAELESKLAEAEAIREALTPWLAWDRSREELAEAKAKVEEIKAALKKLEEERLEVLAKADIPVEGVAITEAGEVTLNGKSFEVASEMEKARMAVQVAFAHNPNLRVCLVDEGNSFGTKALDALHKEAVERDFVVLLCRLGIDGPGEIIVEDGRAYTAGEGQ